MKTTSRRIRHEQTHHSGGLGGGRGLLQSGTAGDTVDEQIVNDFRDCVPPASMSRGYLQVGEAYDHMVDENGRWRPTFMTFAFKDGVWVYCGCCFRGETVHRQRV